MSGQGLRIVPYAGHKGYQCYLDGWKVNGKRKRFLVSAAIEGYLNGKVRAGLSQRHLRDICGRIGRFNEAFGARLIRTVSVREIEDWLHGISLGPQSVVNYRAVANAFFSGSPVKLDDGSHLVIDRTLPLGGRKVNPAFTPSTTTPLRSDKNATPTNFFKAIRGLSAALSLSRAVPEIY